MIRRANLADLDALVQLEQANFNYDQLSRRSFRRFIESQRATLWCCFIDHTLVGYALVLTRKNSRNWRLYSLVVDQKTRGQGVAARLLENLIREAQTHTGTNTVEAITLEVKIDNQAAISLYQKHGFTDCGQLSNYYADGTTALRMILKFR